MSNYQYYEWQAIDAPLGTKRMAEVRDLSSHMDTVTPFRAVVTYSHGGHLKHDPGEVLQRYYDAMVYLANSGSRRLMFRFPRWALDPQQVMAYCVDDWITLTENDGYFVLDITFDDELSAGWIEGEGRLAKLLPLRQQIMAEDYRALYLAWAHAAAIGGADIDDAELEPPVPAGLQELDASLKELIRLFGIDPYLVRAAAETSLPFKPALDQALQDYLPQLTAEEAQAFLLRVLKGEPTAGIALRQRLAEIAGLDEAHARQRRRTVRELFLAADHLHLEAELAAEAEAEARAVEEAQTAAAEELEAIVAAPQPAAEAPAAEEMPATLAEPAAEEVAEAEAIAAGAPEAVTTVEKRKKPARRRRSRRRKPATPVVETAPASTVAEPVPEPAIAEAVLALVAVEPTPVPALLQEAPVASDTGAKPEPRRRNRRKKAELATAVAEAVEPQGVSAPSDAGSTPEPVAEMAAEPQAPVTEAEPVACAPEVNAPAVEAAPRKRARRTRKPEATPEAAEPTAAPEPMQPEALPEAIEPAAVEAPAATEPATASAAEVPAPAPEATDDAAAWAEVEGLVERKQAKAYDQAVALLARLRDEAAQRNDLPAFESRLAAIREASAKRPAFLARLDAAAL